MKTTAILLMAAVTAFAAKAALTVTVEEAKIRKKKLFYAPAVATVAYGDKVQASGPAEDGWIPVASGGEKGWLHESAVSAKKVKAGSGSWSGSAEASAEEVTLAGKGFNESVEKAYRESSGVDYDAVDRMEARRASDEELVRFMKAGGTLPKEAR